MVGKKSRRVQKGDTVRVGDIVVTRHRIKWRECAVCGKPFVKGQVLAYFVTSVGDEGTRAIPAHLQCGSEAT